MDISLKNQLTRTILNFFSSKKLHTIENTKRHISKNFPEKSKMKNLAFTISIDEVSQTIVGGYFLQINAFAPLKNLQMAHEAYCLDERSNHLLSPILYALIYTYALDLTHTPITFHLTSSKAIELYENLQQENDSIAKAIKILLLGIPSAEAVSCVKGPFFEKIQTKMARIKLKDSNELTSLDFTFLANELIKTIN